MTELVAAIAVFIASHMIPAYRPLRNALVGAMGERAYMILYSLISIAVIVWLGVAYARAPYVEVWTFTPWTRWVPVLVMPFACIMLVAGATRPNPLSLSFAPGTYDPGRPGIVSITRHPVIWPLTLWAAAHLPPNGDVASLILFGFLFALGLAGPPSLDHKARAKMPEAEWQRLAAPTSNIPFGAQVAGRARVDWAGIGLRPVFWGLILYAVLLRGHGIVIGVSAIP